MSAAKPRAIAGIDHVMIVVPDIEAAGKAYARLGFEVQPRGVHGHLGTANHLMILDKDYIELLGVITPMPLNERYRQIAAEGGSLANIALASASADLAHQAWTANGLNPEPVLAFDRAVSVGGQEERAAFRIVRLPHEARPGIGIFVCEQRTPQFVYRPEWANHPNGALALSAVTVLAADPQIYAAAANKVFGAGAARINPDGMRVETGAAPIRYLTRAGFARLFPGMAAPRQDDHAAVLSVRVRDIDRTMLLLKNNGVSFNRPTPGRLIVPHGEAGNVLIEFVA